MSEVIPIAGPPPGASIPVSDATALIRQNESLQAELASSRAATARLQEADRTAHKTAAIASALTGAPLVAGAISQIATLFDKDVNVHLDPSTGQPVVCGPNLTPVSAFLQAQLAKPEYSHFLMARNPQGGTAGGSGTQSSPTAPGSSWGNGEPAPPSNLMEAILHHAATTHRPSANAATDMSQPFGLGRRSG
jgi:hypothetical protein